MDTRAVVSNSFRQLLSHIDPLWSDRTREEQEEWVAWYARTARAISTQFARSFRDPCHDASDVLQDILLKLLTKFRPAKAPHRLLTERPCMRNLMQWKGLDRVDWENAERRSARRRAPLPEDEVGLADGRAPKPDLAIEMADSERAFRRRIRRTEDREAYLLFRTGRNPREVARLTGRTLRETKALRESLLDRLEATMAAS